LASITDPAIVAPWRAGFCQGRRGWWRGHDRFYRAQVLPRPCSVDQGAVRSRWTLISPETGREGGPLRAPVETGSARSPRHDVRPTNCVEAAGRSGEGPRDRGSTIPPRWVGSGRLGPQSFGCSGVMQQEEGRVSRGREFPGRRRSRRRVEAVAVLPWTTVTWCSSGPSALAEGIPGLLAKHERHVLAGWATTVWGVA